MNLSDSIVLRYEDVFVTEEWPYFWIYQGSDGNFYTTYFKEKNQTLYGGVFCTGFSYESAEAMLKDATREKEFEPGARSKVEVKESDILCMNYDVGSTKAHGYYGGNLAGITSESIKEALVEEFQSVGAGLMVVLLSIVAVRKVIAFVKREVKAC